jgi:hypothetical protein
MLSMKLGFPKELATTQWPLENEYKNQVGTGVQKIEMKGSWTPREPLHLENRQVSVGKLS